MGRLFGTAGIRGTYLDKVTPELAFNLGAAVPTALKISKLCVGGDVRLTTPLLKSMVSSGAMYVGCDVTDVNLVPMPTLPWSVRKLKCGAGVYVTASHNPPTDNGFKVFNSEGRELTISEEDMVEEVIRSKSWRPATWDSVGKYELVPSVIEDYINELSNLLEPRSVKYVPKVLIDTANGAASQVTPKVLKNLGARVYTLNANVDGRFPGRVPEPRPDVLEPLIPIAKYLGTDVFFAHDGDGDRLAIVDPKEGFVKQDRVLALVAYYKLSERKGTVVVSIDCGNAVKDVVSELGGKLVIVKLGKTHEGLIKYSDVVMAGEPWKLIDPSWGPWVDGIYQAALLTKLMIEEGVGITGLMSKVPNYPQARYSVRLSSDVRDEVFRKLSDYVIHDLPRKLGKRVEEILTIDGVRVDFEDRSWILIRKSGTEPKVRIYGEALSAKELKSIVDDLIGKIIGFSKSLGYEKYEVDGALIP